MPVRIRINVRIINVRVFKMGKSVLLGFVITVMIHIISTIKRTIAKIPFYQ